MTKDGAEYEDRSHAGARATNPPAGRAVASALSQALVVASVEAKAMLLSVRAAFLVVVYGLMAGGLGSIGLWLDAQANGRLQALGSEVEKLSPAEKAELMQQLAERFRSEHLAEAILQGDLPPLLYFVLLLSTFAIPFLVLLVGFNRIADDIHGRFTRYLLQRVHRGAYLAGKVFGHWVVCFLAIVVVHALLVVYGLTSERFDAQAILGGLPRIWLGMSLFVLVYVGYTTFWSVISPSPFLALLLGTMALFALWVVSWIEPIKAVWVGQWDVRLFSLDPIAIGVYLAYATAFLLASYAALRWRDV